MLTGFASNRKDYQDYKMATFWKSNWEETKQNFINWWNREGLVVYIWGIPEVENLHETVLHPGEAHDIEYFYTQPEWRARWNHHKLSRQRYLADTFPGAETNIGPGSLALLVGGEARLADDTVWFEPLIDPYDPESNPPLKFDPESRWWRITEDLLRACVAQADGRYAIGCPDLVENIDIIASLRDPQTLLMDMIERPSWVSEKVWEINEAFFEAYDRIYKIIKMEDGSSSWDAFRIWGPGKTAKVQCDTSAMFSPRMFKKFVVPALTEQCEWLDNSMFHLDGPDCIRHLDLLLDIDPLDAIEWTPGPQVPNGGSLEWYPMYQKILEAGKSVQVIEVGVQEVAPLLDAIGTHGVYIQTYVKNEAELDNLLKVIESYR
jgi:hypothetical protein